jgi:hypothetical protein
VHLSKWSDESVGTEELISLSMPGRENYHFVTSGRFLEIDDYYNVGCFNILAIFQTIAPNF